MTLLIFKGIMEKEPVLICNGRRPEKRFFLAGDEIFRGQQGDVSQSQEYLFNLRSIGNTGSPWVLRHGVAYATSSDGLLYGWDLQTGNC